MPALDAHRLFLSTVTSELGRYRTSLAARFERVSVKAVYQEEFEYADTDLLEKLYTLIEPCDVVIHFVGAGAGAKANPKAVADFLARCERRREDFLGYWKKEHGLEREFFDRLSYTQWEAVIALFLGRHFMPVQPSGPVTDGHPTDKQPFAPTAEDKASQEQHLDWLSSTMRRYPQMLEERDGSYLEDAFDKIIGFLLRLGNEWKTTATRLQTMQAPPLGGHVIQPEPTSNDPESQGSCQNEASASRFGHSSCASFFHSRFVSAFPGIRREIRWIRDEASIIERLQRLLCIPIKFTDIGPIYWFRGALCNSIDSFRVLDEKTVLINNDELVVSKMAGVDGGHYWNSFVYLEAGAAEPSGVRFVSKEQLNQEVEESAYWSEEVCLFRGKYLSRKYFDDRAAEIHGRIVDLGDEAELRTRYLTPYNLIITGNDSSLNRVEFEDEQERRLNEILHDESKLELLADQVMKLPKRFRYSH